MANVFFSPSACFKKADIAYAVDVLVMRMGNGWKLFVPPEVSVYQCLGL